MHKSARRSFLSGVGVLTLSGLVVKVIGLFYRIPLLSVLGTEGMGYFNAAYELYALFCVIATTGLPVAMSVLISAQKAEEGQQPMGTHIRQIFRVSLGAFLVIGLAGTALLWGLSAPFAALLGNGRSALCMRALAPTLLFICLSSALRGYFQGQRNMIPTAISQVVEAAGKLFLGLLFAGMAREQGCELHMTAAYAIAGLTVGTAVSLLYLFLHKYISERKVSPCLCEENASLSRGKILRALSATAVPVTLGAGVIALSKCLDLVLIHRRLPALGYTPEQIASLYGGYSTLAVPIFNILPSLSTSVSLSAIPALAAAFAKGQVGEEEAHRTALSALRVTLLLAIPAAWGMAVYAEDILSLLFAGQPAAVREATPWLACLALSVPASCLVTVTGGMLQAAGHANRPVFSLLAGVGAKAVLSFFLLGDPRFGMMGAPLGSLLCDLVIVLFNIGHLSRLAPAMLPSGREAAELFLLPTALSACSLFSVRLLYGQWGFGGTGTFSTLVTIFTVVCLYGAGSLLCACVPKLMGGSNRDIQPKGVS